MKRYLLLASVLLLFTVAVFMMESRGDEKVFLYDEIMNKDLSSKYNADLTFLKFGTDEYGEMSYQERAEYCQIPDHFLEKGKTDELLLVILINPDMRLIYAWSSFRYGFLQMIDVVNGLEELLKRSDAAKCVFELYRRMAIPIEATNSNNNWMCRNLEVLINQPEIYQNYSEKEIEEIRQISRTNAELRKESVYNTDFFAWAANETQSPFAYDS